MTYQAIHNYIAYEDLIQQAGYRTPKPVLGSLGVALLEASKGTELHTQILKLKSKIEAYRLNRKKKKNGKNS